MGEDGYNRQLLGSASGLFRRTGLTVSRETETVRIRSCKANVVQGILGGERWDPKFDVKSIHDVMMIDSIFCAKKITTTLSFIFYSSSTCTAYNDMMVLVLPLTRTRTFYRKLS
jgi:hypothetical protein